jgi:hypothetical protein
MSEHTRPRDAYGSSRFSAAQKESAGPNSITSHLVIGKSYECTIPNPFPAEMFGAIKTITFFGKDMDSVGYDYVRKDGITGSGSMTFEHAEKYLKPTED